MAGSSLALAISHLLFRWELENVESGFVPLGCTKYRLDSLNVHLLNQNADVVADKLGIHFVLLSQIVLSFHGIAELPLNHRHGRFHVTSLVVVLKILFPVQAEVVERFLKCTTNSARGVPSEQWEELRVEAFYCFEV